MLFQEFFEFQLDEIDHISFGDEIHLVEEDQNVSHSNLSAEEHMLFSLGHGSIYC